MNRIKMRRATGLLVWLIPVVSCLVVPAVSLLWDLAKEPELRIGGDPADANALFQTFKIPGCAKNVSYWIHGGVVVAVFTVEECCFVEWGQTQGLVIERVRQDEFGVRAQIEADGAKVAVTFRNGYRVVRTTRCGLYGGYDLSTRMCGVTYSCE